MTDAEIEAVKGDEVVTEAENVAAVNLFVVIDV
jgi:hypothetical protein